MPKIVTHQAKLKCPYGSTQGWLQILGANRPTIDGKNIATINDFQPVTQISTFGMCKSPMDPKFSATGVPQPCVPSIITPWLPPCLETINGIPMLLDNCSCMCALGGQITIANPGQSGNVTGELS